MAELTMGWFGTTHERITQKVLWKMRNSTTYEFQKELLKYINEPDQGLPQNFLNHIQTIDGEGKAKEMILKYLSRGDVKSLAHALHYTQDICNPLHTVKDYPIDKHIAYELMIRDVDFGFSPKKHIIALDDVVRGIDRIVTKSYLLFPPLKTAIDFYIINEIMSISEKSLEMAATATHDLILLHLSQS